MDLLILGLGNVLCGDDGVGVAAVAQIERRFRLPEGVELMDGGTLGLALLHYVRQAERLLLVDAIHADRAPGSLVRLTGDEVPSAVASRLSVHQIGVADLLDGLRWTDSGPSEIVLLGLVPETLELGLGRSPAVDTALPALVEAVASEIARMGFGLEARTDDEPLADHRAPLTPGVLGL